MTLRGLLVQWRTNSKLRRGRCAWCEKVLPDTGPADKPTGTCSEECAGQVQLHWVL